MKQTDWQQLTIKEIQSRLQEIEELTDPIFESLQEDSRKGVAVAVRQRQRQIERAERAQADYRRRLTYETDLMRQGYQRIAGIDEVGRGPLAGPVVSACVILPEDTTNWIEVKDSKQLSASRRKELVHLIQQEAVAYSYGVVEAKTIDELNILQATKLAMTEAIDNLTEQPDFLLVDAVELAVDLPQLSLIGGDDCSLSIAAASILAKDYRDELMQEYALTYPGYGFEKHMGYGTKQHLAAIEQLGPTPIHRRSFAPLNQHL